MNKRVEAAIERSDKDDTAMMRTTAPTKRGWMAIAGVGAALLFSPVAEGDEGATKLQLQARNKQSVQVAFDRWRDGTGNFFDLLAPDATWTVVGSSPVSRTYSSRQEFLDVVIKPFNARISKRLVPTVRGVYSDGDMVIALWDGEATARDGKPYRNTYSWYMRMREGRIVSVTAFFDTIAFTDLWTRVTP